MSDKKQGVAAKIVGGVVTLVGVWAAQKAVASAWKMISGHEPPAPEDDGDSRLAEVIGAAVLSSAMVALARVLATRGTAKLLS